MDKIKTQARQRGFNSFRFSFVGGEPTLQKNLLGLIYHYSQDAKNCNHSGLHITTNLSQKSEWLKRFKEAVSPLDLSVVTASFHKEFANREEFVKKVRFLLDNDILCSISIVMVPQKFNTLLKDAAFFYDHSINIYLQLQEDNDNKIVSSYTKEMLETAQTAFPFKMEYWKPQKRKKVKDKISIKIKNQLNSDAHLIELIDSQGKAWFLDNCDRLNALRFNRYKGWECSAGYRSIIINSKGDIKRGFRCYDESLGHLNTGFALLPNVKPCVSPVCSCTADNKIPKRKVGTKHQLFKQASYINPSVKI